MAGILKTLGTTKALVIDDKGNANLFKSVRNLAKAKVLAPEGLNVFDILNHSDLVIAAGAIKDVEKRVLPASSSAPAAA
jgi:large subunit ribosomal protein L4